MWPWSPVACPETASGNRPESRLELVRLQSFGYKSANVVAHFFIPPEPFDFRLEAAFVPADSFDDWTADLPFAQREHARWYGLQLHCHSLSSR